jgi:hypothetical protein
MPDLIRASSTPKIQYTVSLPHSLLATASLVCAAARYEGLGDWLWEARTQIAPELYQDLCLLITFPGGYQRFTAELIARLPAGAARLSFEELMAHLRNIPPVHYQLIALRALARGARPSPQPPELAALLHRPVEWAGYLANVESEVDPDLAAALAGDEEKLKCQLLNTLDRFWKEIYAGEFEATRPLMERSVAYHRAQQYPPSFRDLFMAVTGRPLPDRVVDLLPDIEMVTFIPSCYIGPYVAYTHNAEQLVLYYNCRTTPVGAEAGEGASLYPPLKALADETRLQILALLRGRELYAQEIVNQLDISQPAVSRHLNLMAAAGVLKIRREGNAKYYSIDAEVLAAVANALRTFS